MPFGHASCSQLIQVRLSLRFEYNSPRTLSLTSWFLRQAEARAVCCGLRRLVGELLQTVLSDGASDVQTTAPEVKRTGSTYKRGRASDDSVFAVRHLERRRRGCTRLPIEFAPSGPPHSRELRPSRPNLRSVVVYLVVLRCGRGADGRDQRAISWCTRGA